MNERELSHSGVIGMRWGRRLYQNKDGTYTALGKARRRKGSIGGKYDRLFEPTIKRGKDKAPQSPAEVATKEASNMGDKASNIFRRAQRIADERKPRESKQLTDDELRKRINRLELEKRYDTLKDEDIRKGKVTAKDILDTVGDLTALSASAVAIYVALKHR